MDFNFVAIWYVMTFVLIVLYFAKTLRSQKKRYEKEIGEMRSLVVDRENKYKSCMGRTQEFMLNNVNLLSSIKNGKLLFPSSESLSAMHFIALNLDALETMPKKVEASDTLTPQEDGLRKIGTLLGLEALFSIGGKSWRTLYFILHHEPELEKAIKKIVSQASSTECSSSEGEVVGYRVFEEGDLGFSDYTNEGGKNDR